MSVLLQLASNTPRPAGGNATSGPVFRSPNAGKGDRSESENLPALQLPMIGGQNGRKSKQGDDFAPPQLGMRSGSGSKTVLSSGSRKENEVGEGEADGEKKGRAVAYPMHPPYPRDTPSYYPPVVPPGMHGPGGSMRVVVGGPPPGGSPPRPGMGNSPHQAPPYYDHPYPPPPGMYSQYHHVGYPYQYPHHPARHNMPMYGGQQQQSAPLSQESATKKGAKRPNKGTKRGSPLLDPKVSKKPRKSPSKTKNKVTPQLEGEDRDKAAASILAVNAASGGKNDKAAALAAAILRGVTMRPSGKWVSFLQQLLHSATLSRIPSHNSYYQFTASPAVLCGQVEIHWCIRFTRKSRVGLRNSKREAQAWSARTQWKIN